MKLPKFVKKIPPKASFITIKNIIYSFNLNCQYMHFCQLDEANKNVLLSIPSSQITGSASCSEKKKKQN